MRLGRPSVIQALVSNKLENSSMMGWKLLLTHKEFIAKMKLKIPFSISDSRKQY